MFSSRIHMTNGLEDGLKYRSDLMSKGLGLPLDILSPRLFVQRMRASIEAEFLRADDGTDAINEKLSHIAQRNQHDRAIDPLENEVFKDVIGR